MFDAISDGFSASGCATAGTLWAAEMPQPLMLPSSAISQVAINNQSVLHVKQKNQTTICIYNNNNMNMNTVKWSEASRAYALAVRVWD